jgi:tetratricopeptide (TPR) repeat protein
VSSAQIVAIAAVTLPALAITLWPLLRARGGRIERGVPPGDRRLELLEEKGTAYRALKELTFDYEAGHLSDDDYRGLRQRYESRAADVLAALDALEATAPVRDRSSEDGAQGEATTTRRGFARHPAALVGGAALVLIFGIVIGLNVGRFSEPDPSMAVPGGPAVSQGAGGVGPPNIALEPGKAIPPGILAGMLSAARQSLVAGRYGEAIAAYQAVLKRDPRNVDAMTHLGLIVAIGGHADAALETFDKAATIDPAYPPIYLYRGQLLYEVKHDYPGAIKAWGRFLTLVPSGEDHDRVVALVKDAQGQQQKRR